MKNHKFLLFLFLLASSILLHSCNDDEPEPATDKTPINDFHILAEVEVLKENFSILGEDYHVIFSNSLDQLLTTIINDEQLKTSLNEVMEESNLRDQLSLRMEEVFDGNLINLSQTLGDSIREGKRRMQGSNNFKQFGVALNNESSFLDDLKSGIDQQTQGQDTDHSSWSDLISIGDAGLLSDQLSTGSLTIDINRTRNVFDDQIKELIPAFIKDEVLWKNTIRELLIKGYEEEAILLSFYIPAIKNMDLEMVSQAIDSVVHSIAGGNDVLIGDQGRDIIRGSTSNNSLFGNRSNDLTLQLYEITFYAMLAGIIPNEDFPAFTSFSDAVVSMYHSMFTAVIYSILDYSWDAYSEIPLKTRLLLETGKSLSDLYSQAVEETFNTIMSNNQIIDSSRTSDKSKFIRSIESQILPTAIQLFSSFGINGSFHNPESRINSILKQVGSVHTKYPDLNASYEPTLAHLLDSIRSIEGRSQVVLADKTIQTFTHSTDSLHNATYDERKSIFVLENLDVERVQSGDDQITRQVIIELIDQGYNEEIVLAGLILPALQKPVLIKKQKEAIRHLISSVLGNTPDDLENELNRWVNLQFRILLKVFPHVFSTADSYRCMEVDCLLINAYHELYTASYQYLLQMAWEYMEEKAVERISENLISNGETFGFLFTKSLSSSLSTMANFDTTELIASGVETFDDFVKNTSNYTGDRFSLEVQKLSNTIEETIDTPSSSLLTIANRFNATRFPLEDMIPWTNSLDLPDDNESKWIELILANKDPRSPETAINHSISIRNGKQIHYDQLNRLIAQPSREVLSKSNKLSLEKGHATSAVINSLILPVIYLSDQPLISQTLVENFLKNALDANSIPDISNRVNYWESQIHQQLAYYSAISVMIRTDEFQCSEDLSCIYANMYKEMYLWSYYYLLGEIWSFMEDYRANELN